MPICLTATACTRRSPIGRRGPSLDVTYPGRVSDHTCCDRVAGSVEARHTVSGCADLTVFVSGSTVTPMERRHTVSGCADVTIPFDGRRPPYLAAHYRRDWAVRRRCDVAQVWRGPGVTWPRSWRSRPRPARPAAGARHGRGPCHNEYAPVGTRAGVVDGRTEGASRGFPSAGPNAGAAGLSAAGR